jgi:hypothetical protein
LIYSWLARIRSTTIRGRIGRGQIRIRIPKRIKKECQMVKVIDSGT